VAEVFDGRRVDIGQEAHTAAEGQSAIWEREREKEREEVRWGVERDCLELCTAQGLGWVGLGWDWR
jgi:hypothetical protein